MKAARAPAKAEDWRGYLVGTALVLALMGYNAVAMVLPTAEEGGSGVTVIFRAASVAIFAAAWLAGPRTPHFRAASLWALHAFLLLYTLRLADNFYLRHLVWFAEPSVAFGLLLGSAWIPAILLPGRLPLPSERAFFVPMAAACAVFLAGVALNIDAFRSPDTFFGRAGTEKLNPISLGSAATSFALFLLLWRHRAWQVTLAQYVAVAGFLGLALLTQSRGPMVATGVVMLLLMWGAQGETRRRLMRLVVLGAVVAVAGMASFMHDIAALGFQRFLANDGAMDDSAMGRVFAWAAAWDQFLQTPVLGDLVFEPTLLRYPHNLFMETLIALGLVGAILLVVHLAVTLRAVVGLLREPDAPAYVIFIAVTAVKELIQAQFSGAVYTNTGVWVASACVIALHAARRREVRQQHALRRADLIEPTATAWRAEPLFHDRAQLWPRP